MKKETPTLHPKEDYQLMVELRKVANPTTQQMDQIFNLYRKYIEYLYSYSINCNCSTSIWNIWSRLNEWMMKNENQFEK